MVTFCSYIENGFGTWVGFYAHQRWSCQGRFSRSRLGGGSNERDKPAFRKRFGGLVRLVREGGTRRRSARPAEGSNVPEPFQRRVGREPHDCHALLGTPNGSAPDPTLQCRRFGADAAARSGSRHSSPPAPGLGGV